VIAFAATMIFAGTFMAAAFSSAGPILFDRVHGASRFGDLISALNEIPQDRNILRISDYLFKSYAEGLVRAGTGISAFPSIHVAVAVLNALFFTSISAIFGTVMWCFAAIIFIGSIYTGYHYSVDGIVSTGIVIFVWKFAGTITGKYSTVIHTPESALA
jgi:membrane-associated phospholipid phosphatase